MNLTDLLVPTYSNMLQTLKGLLDKAEAQLGPEKAEALLSARMAPDMFPLATQIRFAVVQAYDGPRRLRGEEHPPEEIGKADYVPHMFAFLRPAPTS